MKKKILVTGGAGFIGSHICEELAKNNKNDVFSLDNYTTGSVSNHIKNVSYIKGNTFDVDKLVPFHPDLIFHLGEYSRVEQSFKDIEKVFKSNIHGTISILEFSKRCNCKKTVTRRHGIPQIPRFCANCGLSSEVLRLLWLILRQS